MAASFPASVCFGPVFTGAEDEDSDVAIDLVLAFVEDGDEGPAVDPGLDVTEVEDKRPAVDSGLVITEGEDEEPVLTSLGFWRGCRRLPQHAQTSSPVFGSRTLGW